MILLTEEFSKQDCQKMFEDVIDEFSEIPELEGYFYPNIIKPKLNWLKQTNRKALGLCRGRYYKSTLEPIECEIFLNPNMLKFEDDKEQIIKDTLAHELVHTCKGCNNHGSEFHRIGNLIRWKLGYVIDTKADMDASAYFLKYLPDAKYRVVCRDCGAYTSYQRLSNAVSNPCDYVCTKCGGKVDSYMLNNMTNDYELYKSADEEKEAHKHQFICANCDWRIGFDKKNKRVTEWLNHMLNFGTLSCPKCGSGLYYEGPNLTLSNGIISDMTPKERQIAAMQINGGYKPKTIRI